MPEASLALPDMGISAPNDLLIFWKIVTGEMFIRQRRLATFFSNFNICPTIRSASMAQAIFIS